MPVSSMKTRRAGSIPASSARHTRRASATSSRSCSAALTVFSSAPGRAPSLPCPAQGRGAAPAPGALGEPVGVLGQGGVVPLRHQPGQRLPLAAEGCPATAARLGGAAPLLAGELEPARERALADPVGPRDLGPAALAGL